MTSSLPKRPLWPRSGRSGRSAAAASSSRTGPAVVDGPASADEAPPAGAAARPKPTGRSATVVLLGERTEAFHPLEDPALPVVQPGLDVGREEETPSGGPHAERDGDRELGLVADGDGHPAHAQLRGPGSRPAVEADSRLAG